MKLARKYFTKKIVIQRGSKVYKIQRFEVYGGVFLLFYGCHTCWGKYRIKMTIEERVFSQNMEHLEKKLKTKVWP